VTDQHARFRAGLFLGLGAYLIWGVLPLSFKALVHVDPTQVVAHRVLWSLILLGGMIAILGERPRAGGQPRLLSQSAR
jgi:chloramphenicol-sensitive protein RarD